MKKSRPKESAEHVETIRRLAGTIHLLRSSHNMTLRECAKQAKVGYADIFRLENATTMNPSVYLVNSIASVFGMTIDELMNFKAKECPRCKGAGWIKGD